VLIRCRDLGEDDLCRSFTDFLTQHLRKTELLPEDADVMRAVILDRIAKGEALLLVDGLDEITSPLVRVMFCQELERTAARYPEAPIVVTSRIVGYRDMPYRMGSGFEHGEIAELTAEDKDLFARRWVEVTEHQHPAAEREKRAQELIDDLHSNDRIERLTGNPMLLTTLALVKRKVGKLPNRRTKLYAEAVSLLLNWNPRIYRAIEEDEAIPQLEYLAYEMCRRGVQRLPEDEVLDLLDRLRVEYPNIRAIRRRAPHEFLKHLEERSGILIKSGGIWGKDEAQARPVWEFRHLTFQEYLAAHALLDGRYPDRDKTKSLAEQVAPLAGPVTAGRVPEGEEVDVPESWREALRLLVADCKDDDVDDVLLSILNPLPGEDASMARRPRAVLAALCLADEPNVSEESAKRVLSVFSCAINERDGNGAEVTTIDSAATEVGRSIWSQLLKESLISEYCARPPQTRPNPGSLWGTAEISGWERSGLGLAANCTGLSERLGSGERVEVLSAALAAMVAAFEGKVADGSGLPEKLLMLFGLERPEIAAAGWALAWMAGWDRPVRKPVWLPSDVQSEAVVKALSEAPDDENHLRRYLMGILARSADKRGLAAVLSNTDHANAQVRRAAAKALGALGDGAAARPLLSMLDDPDPMVSHAAVEALGKLGDKTAVPALLARLDGPNVSDRRRAVEILGELGDKDAIPALTTHLEDADDSLRPSVVGALARIRNVPMERKLLSLDLDDGDPWIDPKASITEARLEQAAERLGLTRDKVYSLYASIAVDFHLQFE
jgi:HEAT repeat protein